MKLLSPLRFPSFSILSLVLSVLLLTNPDASLSQLPSIGTPYSSDSNTVVLMHFDGNLQNQSSMQVAQKATQLGDHVFLPDSSVHTSFNGSLYLDNEREEYNAVLIPDTAALDLDHDWTFNAWIRADKWVSEYTDGGPRILHKPGSPFYKSNWYFAPYPDGHLKAGFRHETDWFELNSKSGLIQSDRWYHITYIRDTSRSAVIQMIHNRAGKLLWSEKKKWNSGGENPTNTDKPLYIGLNPKNGNGSNQKWIGNIDEVWISNTVREYSNVQIPFFKNAAKVDSKVTPEDTLQFKIEMDWYGPEENQVSVYLNYNTGDGWAQKKLDYAGGQQYRGQIPKLPAGTGVEYYYSAEIDSISKGRFPKDQNYDFVVEAPESKLLKVSFEEESGAPIDSTSYHNILQVYGGPDNALYTDEAIDGSHAYNMDGQNDLSITSRLLDEETYTISLWFHTGSDLPKDGTRLLAKELTNDSSKVNYALVFRDKKLTARSTYSHNLTLNSRLKTKTWYRVVYMVSKNAVSLQLYNRDGRIAHTIDPLYVRPLNKEGPLYIGQGRYHSSLGFKGRVDQIQIWNYPALEGPFLIQSVTRYVNKKTSNQKHPIETHIYHTGDKPPTMRLHYRSQNRWHTVSMDKRNANDSYTASIPGQTSPTVIPYYVEGYSSNGDFHKRKPAGAGSVPDSATYKIGFVDPYEQVLDMDFESFRSDTNLPIPIDQSAYSAYHDIRLYGRTSRTLPEKSDDAIQGTTSMQFSRTDSTFMELDSPFLSAHDFTLSFWFKPSANLSGNNERLISRQGGKWITSFWWVSNFDVRINKQKQLESFYSFTHCLDCIHPVTDTTVQAGNWYRVIYEYHSRDSAYIQLRNAQNEIIDQHGTSNVNGPSLKTAGPLSIAHAGSRWEPYFSGNIDHVELYNYAATLDPPQISNVTQLDFIESGEGPHEIQANVSHGGRTPVLHYRTTEYSSWKTQAMQSSDSIYTASLPDHSAGTVVKYYITARNDFGTVSRRPSDTAETSFYHAYYGQENSVVLDLTFENSEQILNDKSPFDHEVSFHGRQEKPVVSEYAASGKQSLKFSSRDSTYLEVSSRWLSPQTYTVDIWFNMADTSNRGVQLIYKQASGDIWWEPTFAIEGIGNGSWTAGAYHPNIKGDYREKFSTNYFKRNFRNLSLADTSWYHVQLVRETDSVHFILLNAQDQLIKQASGVFKAPVNQTEGPLRIGHAGPSGQPYFNGWIDRVRILNYANKTYVDIPEKQASEQPAQYRLYSNYPNPFNPITTIRYELPEPARITLSVYTLLGRKVATLVNGKKEAGQHQVTFNGENLSSGIYIYRLQNKEFSASKKMLLVK